MDWSNEPYVRLYTRETTDDLELSWDALALWRALLCKFDRSGLMEARHGWASVARAVRCDVERIEAAGAELVRDGRVRLVKGGVFAPNYVAAQTASKSDKVRQRESRDRRRAHAESEHSTGNAHSNHGVAHTTSQPVTSGHAPSQNVTLCSADPLLAVAEPLGIPRDKHAAPPDSPQLADFKLTVDAAAAKAKKPKRANRQIPDDWSPRPQERRMATELGLDCDAQAAAFVDHHRSKGNTFADHDAAFRSWLRKSESWDRNRQKPKQQGGVSDALLRMASGDS